MLLLIGFVVGVIVGVCFQAVLESKWIGNFSCWVLLLLMTFVLGYGVVNLIMLMLG